MWRYVCIMWETFKVLKHVSLSLSPSLHLSLYLSLSYSLSFHACHRSVYVCLASGNTEECTDLNAPRATNYTPISKPHMG